MSNIHIRKAVSAIIAGFLIIGLCTTTVSAAPKESGKPTGRTEQKVMTGVISYDGITVPRYAKEVTLSGTVVIDGPELVMDVAGATNISVAIIGDKLSSYEAVVDVSLVKGDFAINIPAHTIYPNGKVAGSIHTGAPDVTQTIHVLYIVSNVMENEAWTAYNRESNEFTLYYDEVENWSVGDPVITAKTLYVDGLLDQVALLDKTLEVPIVNRSARFLPETTVWIFDVESQTYVLNLDIEVLNSKGSIGLIPFTKTGLLHSSDHLVFHTLTDEFGIIMISGNFLAPDVPVKTVKEIQDLQMVLVYQKPKESTLRSVKTIRWIHC